MRNKINPCNNIQNKYNVRMYYFVYDNVCTRMYGVYRDREIRIFI